MFKKKMKISIYKNRSIIFTEKNTTYFSLKFSCLFDKNRNILNNKLRCMLGYIKQGIPNFIFIFSKSYSKINHMMVLCYQII